MATRGWNAKGLLRPLWLQYAGGDTEEARRDALALAVGTKGTVLSAINSGSRNLGWDLGPRLAAELGVSLLELGAPEEAADAKGQTLVDRLRELGEQVAFLMESRETLTKDLADARTRIARLERARKRPGAAAKPRQGTGR